MILFDQDFTVSPLTFQRRPSIVHVYENDALPIDELCDFCLVVSIEAALDLHFDISEHANLYRVGTRRTSVPATSKESPLVRQHLRFRSRFSHSRRLLDIAKIKLSAVASAKLPASDRARVSALNLF